MADVNYSRDFETNSNTGWTETDTGSKLDYYSSDYGHNGSSHSMKVVVDADDIVAMNEYDIGSAYTSVSHCFWIYISSFTSTAGTTAELAYAKSDWDEPITRIYIKDAGSNVPSLAIRGTDFSSYQDIATGAWYRLEWVSVNNGASSLKIYNSSGSQVGSTLTATGANSGNGEYKTKFGVAGGLERFTIYFDNIGFDWTDATTPLWPWEAEAAGSRVPIRRLNVLLRLCLSTFSTLFGRLFK